MGGCSLVDSGTALTISGRGGPAHLGTPPTHRAPGAVTQSHTGPRPLPDDYRVSMNPLLAAVVAAALVAVATVLGLLWRAAQGRIRHTLSDAVTITGVDLAPGATLVQFSSEFCAPCRATAQLLEELTAQRSELAHVELDVTERPELASRFNILQTPTTLVLDREGRIRARIGGAVRRDELVAELDRVLVTS